jgi:hypothetical protein
MGVSERSGKRIGVGYDQVDAAAYFYQQCAVPNPWAVACGGGHDLESSWDIQPHLL